VWYRFFVCILFIFRFLLAADSLLVGPEQENLQAKVVSLINNARHRIWVAMYQLTAAPCVYALVNAQRRGVDVQLVLDRGMFLLPVYSFVRRHLHGAHIPHFWAGGKPLMHHKLAIIDNIILVGSANWTSRGLNKNHECCLLSTNRGLVQVVATYFKVLCRRTSGVAVALPVFDTEHDIFFIPDQAALLKKRLLGCIESAQQSIAVSMYAFTSGWLLRALCKAAARGVRVRVLLDPSQLHDERFIAQSKKHGIQCKIYHVLPGGGILHDKMLLIDKAETWLGSMNWTRAGTRYNAESYMRVTQSAVVKKAEEVFEGLWNYSVSRTKVVAK
jgi:phosphatidylserine/phosphatidylglycerophosphate/cardiolipin synthase-like enzyme